ncbi:MAG: hypothetical protein ABEI27_04925 [Halobellus sp.]|uniref:hypothetical protein n=1 Tax=Halobellus sp. TaxID=1979212 RepID=UPI0035D42D00
MSDAPQSREVARRVFAAEFDDATLSYSEGDEERAPNYVVTPTGARTNRLFAVGALTEVDQVTDDIVRGRIADPTGVFVSYAGQYQPDAMAFLERATPPSFVSLTGKARTYQPEDSDRIYTSVRPESLNEVDADTRDRWVVAAAEATLERVATMTAALDIDARGDQLRAELESRGVDDALAQGVALAIDHYDPTEHYLETVRRIAIQGLELVAGERETVDSLDVAPDENGPDTLGPLPSVDAAPAAADGVIASTVGETDDTPTDATTEVTDDVEAVGSNTDASATGAGNAVSADDAYESVSPSDSSGSDSREGTPSSIESDIDADSTRTERGTSADEPSADEPSASEAADAEDGSMGTATATDEAEAESGSDGLGDFGVDDESIASEAPATDDKTTTDDVDIDEDGMYELDPEERAEVEAEFGTEFSTGNEVSDPGEAGIDVPDADELESEVSDEELSSELTANATETDAASRTQSDAASETGTDAVSETDATPATGADAAETEPDLTADSTGASPSEASPIEGDDLSTDDASAARSSATEPSTASPDADSEGVEADSDEADAADVDLEAEAVSMMDDLDDGDGADREAVIAAVVDAHGVDPGDVEDAIQEALMSGQCYEPSEGTLKAI